MTPRPPVALTLVMNARTLVVVGVAVEMAAVALLEPLEPRRLPHRLEAGGLTRASQAPEAGGDEHHVAVIVDRHVVGVQVARGVRPHRGVAAVEPLVAGPRIDRTESIRQRRVRVPSQTLSAPWDATPMALSKVRSNTPSCPSGRTPTKNTLEGGVAKVRLAPGRPATRRTQGRVEGRDPADAPRRPSPNTTRAVPVTEARPRPRSGPADDTSAGIVGSHSIPGYCSPIIA